MSQHDNGRRTPNHQSPSQQGSEGHRDELRSQQDQAQGSRYGSQYGPADDARSWRRDSQRGASQHEQFNLRSDQQGDDWGQGNARGPRAYGRDMGDRAMPNADRMRGQPSDNDYGNRGVTESGNFGNYGSRHESGVDEGYGTTRGRNEAWRRAGREFGGASRSHGPYGREDNSGARSNEAWRGGSAYGDRELGPRDYGPSGSLGEGDYGEGRWNADRSRSGGGGWDDDRGQRWSNAQRQGAAGGAGSWRSVSAQEHYGDQGRQGNWVGGHDGQSFHDPDYHQWRTEQMRALDRDYDEWRQHRYQRFADDFNSWRSDRQRAGTQESREAGGESAHAASSVTAAQLEADAGRGEAQAADKRTNATAARDASKK